MGELHGDNGIGHEAPGQHLHRQRRRSTGPAGRLEADDVAARPTAAAPLR
jgi:hypothetical protein